MQTRKNIAKFNIPHVPFYFMRHGETEWNRERRIMGHQDIPLNAEGVKQADQAVRSLKQLKIDLIISSPLLRAKQTASIIHSSLALPLQINPDLAEVRWGEREGKLLEKDWDQGKWIEGYTPRGAESSFVFQQRIINALISILNQYKKTHHKSTLLHCLLS